MASAQSGADTASVLATGITGELTESGLASPTYALSFVPVQRLMLQASSAPIMRSHADSMLAGTPVALPDLVRLGLLRQDGQQYRINYLVLTAEDQRTIHRVAQAFGADLARAIDARRSDFRRHLARYPNTDLRDAIEFDLVAGMLLNWEGLALSTRLGYRAAPVHHANGDEYLVHSSERGANLDLRGIYWGSESWPAGTITFTTFGDPLSKPRTRGLPNTYDAPFEELKPLRGLPDVYGAVRNQLLTYLGVAMADHAAVLAILAKCPTTEQSLTSSSLGVERVHSSLRLLGAIGYVRDSAGSYRVTAPMLTERDRPLVDSTLALGRDILTTWLAQNHAGLERQLTGLSPLRAGLPFPLVFSEVWHYVFGFATKSLAESGFYMNPRSSNWPDPGYVPLVWAAGLYKL